MYKYVQLFDIVVRSPSATYLFIIKINRLCQPIDCVLKNICVYGVNYLDHDGSLFISNMLRSSHLR